MTQIEFDQKMHEINVQQNGEYKELDALLVENRRQQSRVQEQINSAKEVLAAIKEQRCELHARRGDIARRYHAMKDQLVKGNPKAYGTPTDRGGDFHSRGTRTASQDAERVAGEFQGCRRNRLRQYQCAV